MKSGLNDNYNIPKEELVFEIIRKNSIKKEVIKGMPIDFNKLLNDIQKKHENIR